jgi:hypothetical protein
VGVAVGSSRGHCGGGGREIQRVGGIGRIDGGDRRIFESQGLEEEREAEGARGGESWWREELQYLNRMAKVKGHFVVCSGRRASKWPDCTPLLP